MNFGRRAKLFIESYSNSIMSYDNLEMIHETDKIIQISNNLSLDFNKPLI